MRKRNEKADYEDDPTVAMRELFPRLGIFTMAYRYAEYKLRQVFIV